MPAEYGETAKVRGYDTIRYRGDKVTPAFDTAITDLFAHITAAAKAGTNQRMIDTADLLAISGGGDNGAFTAGLLSGWTASGTRPVFEAVTGSGTGALARDGWTEKDIAYDAGHDAGLGGQTGGTGRDKIARHEGHGREALPVPRQ